MSHDTRCRSSLLIAVVLALATRWHPWGELHTAWVFGSARTGRQPAHPARVQMLASQASRAVQHFQNSSAGHLEPALRRRNILQWGASVALAEKELAVIAGIVAGASGTGPADPAFAFASTADEREAVKVFKSSTPGVVAVARRAKPGAASLNRPGQDSENPPSVGSGFVWDENHIVTNNHVVKDIGEGGIDIVFLDTKTGEDDTRREVLRGEVVGSDTATDIAVVKVEKPTKRLIPMSPLPRGKSSELDVGQTVYAIGNPFGLEHSMSRGIISGISRTLELGDRPIRNCIQTDASINPGNSGGPLLDSAGRVIGVNTAILTASGSFAGIGLAIPIDTVVRNVEYLLTQGFVSRGFLGITFGPDVVSQVLQLPGVVVFGVVPGSPAQQAGVRPKANSTLGDVITSIDGKQVRTGSDIFRLLDKRKPGDNIQLGLLRGRRDVNGTEVVQDLSLDITLGSSGPKK
mmetsp:Transcript_66172/g.123510  ORF Transcript_66172/g.123510 Transcript_66172/m.123510 type:complete len:463 (+) Transcript_66172:34-1422(+)